MNDQQDFSMAFLDTADGLTTLMIHGFPLSSALWQPQIEDLKHYTRIIAPDLRGHGQSDAVPGPYSISLLADDCVDLMGHLNVAPPFVVSGLSMGGYIAFEIYRRYSEHVGGLILTATRAAGDSEDGKINRDKTIKLVREQGIEALIEGMLPKLVSSKTAASQSELMLFIQDMMMETSVEGVVGALAAMRDRPDSTSMLNQIQVPTLIIHGQDDQIIPVAEAKAMAKEIPNAELVIIPGAGHVPNLEQPDSYNDAVIDFLDSVESAWRQEESEDE